MLIFSEYQTGTIDLLLDFYGYEDCQPNYSFGPAIRDGFVLHFITKGKGVFHYKATSRVRELSIFPFSYKVWKRLEVQQIGRAHV